MHSARELCGVADPGYLAAAATAFLDRPALSCPRRRVAVRRRGCCAGGTRRNDRRADPGEEAAQWSHDAPGRRALRARLGDVAGAPRAGAVGRRVPRAAAAVAAPARDARHLPELGAVRPAEGLVTLPAHRRVRRDAHVRLHLRGRDGRRAGPAAARRAARARSRHRLRLPARRALAPALGALHRGRVLRRGRPAGRCPRRRGGRAVPGREHPVRTCHRARGRSHQLRGDAGVLRPGAARAPAHRRGPPGRRQHVRAEGRAAPRLGTAGDPGDLDGGHGDAAAVGASALRAAGHPDDGPRHHARAPRPAHGHRPAARTCRRRRRSSAPAGWCAAAAAAAAAARRFHGRDWSVPEGLPPASIGPDPQQPGQGRRDQHAERGHERNLAQGPRRVQAEGDGLDAEARHRRDRRP